MEKYFSNFSPPLFLRVYFPVYSVPMSAQNTAQFIELEFIPLAIIEGLTHEEVIKNAPPKNPVRGSDELPDVVDGDRFLKVNYPQRREIVQGLLHLGAKLLLAGASKAGKTWLLLALATAVASGEPWIGLATRKSRVLYVNLEILPDFFQQRCRMVRDKMDLKSVGSLAVWNLRGYATDIEKMVDKILEKIEAADGYELVVIDPVYKCYGGRDENNAGDMADFLSHLERIAATTGAAIAFSTHFSKGNQSGKNILDRTSGSGVFARDADTYLSVTEHEQDGHFVVETVVRNGPAVPAFVLRKEFPLFVRDDTLDPARLKRTNRRAKPAAQQTAPAQLGRKPKFADEELLNLLPAAGMSYSDWGKTAKDALGCAETTFKEKRKALVENGTIIQIDNRYLRATAGPS